MTLQEWKEKREQLEQEVLRLGNSLTWGELLDYAAMFGKISEEIDWLENHCDSTGSIG